MRFLNYCEFQLAVFLYASINMGKQGIFITRWVVSISRADKPRKLPAAAYSRWSDGWVWSFSQEMQWEPLAHSHRHPDSSQVRGWKHPQASTDRTARNLQTEHSLGTSVVQEFGRFFPATHSPHLHTLCHSTVFSSSPHSLFNSSRFLIAGVCLCSLQFSFPFKELHKVTAGCTHKTLNRAEAGGPS